MTQALPAVDRFMAHLPGPPVAPMLPSSLVETTGFAASLPALADFAGEQGEPIFPDQLQTAPAETDVLPPIGSLPGQLPGLTGAAPVLQPARPPAAPEVVRVVVPSAEPAAAPAIQRSIRPAEVPVVSPLGISAPTPLVQPLGPPEPPTPASFLQSLPLESTLTGNVLPSAEYSQVQRMPAHAAEGLADENELVQPPSMAFATTSPGERLTVQQRTDIEDQRGQGQPLPPLVRQTFEQAYGQPLDDVRIHTDPAAHDTAESLNAIAFASGRDLFFTQNTFAPDQPEGLSLLGHELAHVIQQQYGLPGDADALRPATDIYERQADQLAASALGTPMALPPAPEPLAEVRTAASTNSPEVRSAPVPVQPQREPNAPRPIRVLVPMPQPSSTSVAQGPLYDEALPLTERAAPIAPIQRFSFDDATKLVGDASQLPSLRNAPEQMGGLASQFANPAEMLSNAQSYAPEMPGAPGMGDLGSLSQNLPGLGALSQGTLPQLSRAMGGPGDMASQMPSLSGLAQSVPGMPSAGVQNLGSMAQGLAGGLAGQPTLPSLGGLKPPDLPLAEGLGSAAESAGGAAAAAGQEALGTITSMGPAAAEAAGAPPLPSLEKLTEHIWKQVQHKLKVERERSRGLA